MAGMFGAMAPAMPGMGAGVAGAGAPSAFSGIGAINPAMLTILSAMQNGGGAGLGATPGPAGAFPGAPSLPLAQPYGPNSYPMPHAPVPPTPGAGATATPQPNNLMAMLADPNLRKMLGIPATGKGGNLGSPMAGGGAFNPIATGGTQ